MRRFVIACLPLLLAGAAGAQEPPEPKQVTLAPALAPVPALKYRLLPEVLEQRPGNAAEAYLESGKRVVALADGQVNQASTWLAVPLEDLPRDKVRALLASCQKVLEHAEAGARCEFCDWGLSTRLREKGFLAPLEDTQRMRSVIVLLALRLRLEVAEGNYDRAAATARVGLTMARHVGEAPTLINSLVGMAMTTVLLNGLEEWITQPGAPNLVWALETLPRPFIDLRRPFQGERLSVYSTFPGMERVSQDRDADLTPEEHKKISDFLTTKGNELALVPNRAALATLLLAKNDTSKQYLEKVGWPRERLARMSALQVGMLHALTEFDEYLDDMIKCQGLPYWEAQPLLQQANQRHRQMRAKGAALLIDSPPVPLAALFIPGADRIVLARVRMDRRIAALTALEAIRLHAATHDGALPATLAASRAAPVPVDPGTGKPFAYRVEGDKAFLSAPLLQGQAPVAPNVVSYEITLRRNGN